MKDGNNRKRLWLPPASAGPDGLVGVGGDLRPQTLIRAYCEGVFPWFNDGDPILWWSPTPRGIFEFDQVHVSRSLLKTLKSGRFRITINQDFVAVIQACANAREEGTWITARMIDAYTTLHKLGYAHSLETWVRDETDTDWLLAGGIYGVAIGGLFAGESMFFNVTDGSKVALVALAHHLQKRGYTLFDTQMVTEHTTRMGAIEIPRADYLERLEAAVAKTEITFT